ncbi:MFS transporter [Kitasatospora sp. SC0581]|uniref:MFS transporter n=1 Tax=Kitasatospora sp. SC0581 TaxID=3394360 RepID=UPI003A85F7FB
MRQHTDTGKPSAPATSTSPTSDPTTSAPAAPGDTARPIRYRWVVLAVATVTQAASGFFVQGIGAMAVPLQHALSLSTSQLGLLLSASQLVPLVGLLVAGELLDRYNERWVVGLGAAVVAAALLLGSLAQGYASLLAVLLVVGAGYSTVQPGGSKSVASWFDPAQRGLAMGVRQAGLPLGGALAAAVLPLVAVAYGWRAALVVGGLVAFLGAGLFTALYRRPPTAPPVRPAPAPARGNTPGPVAPTASVRARLRILREPAMARLLFSGLALVSVHSGIGVLGALYLHDVTALGPGAGAAVLVAVQVAGAVGRIALAAWSDRSRAGRYRPVLFCLAAVVAGLVVLTTPAGRSPAAAAVLFTWLGFFGIGWYGPWVAHLAESAPPGRTGFALGLVMAVNQVAVVVVPPALGLLRDTTHGFTATWAALAATTAVTLAATARRGAGGRGTPPRPGRHTAG